MNVIKNCFSAIIFLIAVLVTFNAATLHTSSNIHQIYVTCNFILAVLMFIWSYLLADFRKV